MVYENDECKGQIRIKPFIMEPRMKLKVNEGQNPVILKVKSGFDTIGPQNGIGFKVKPLVEVKGQICGHSTFFNARYSVY